MKKNSAKPKKTPKVHKKKTKRKEQLRTKKAKELMLKELVIALGNVTSACIETGIDRKTYYKWLDKDKDFKQSVDYIPEITLDFFEGALMKQIKKGNIAGIIFALKSKGKKRGWEEKHETKIDMSLTKIDVKFEMPKEFKEITDKSYLPDNPPEAPKTIIKKNAERRANGT